MKYAKILLLLFAASFFACTQSSVSGDERKDSTANQAMLKPNRITTDSLIVPGKSVGKLYLKQDVQDLEQILGKADGGDAAMGKAWGIWYDKNSNGSTKDEIDVYSSYADTSMVKKDIKQIRITANSFATKNQLRTGNGLSAFLDEFKDAEKLSTFLDVKTKDSILIYDSKRNGIGVEVVKNIITAITIHEIGIPVNATYLTLHPEWKPLE